MYAFSQTTVNAYKPDLVEFGIYFHYVRKLKFDEAPDYAFLQALFDKALNRLGTTDDGLYDWLLMNDGKGWQVKELKRVPVSPRCVY